MPIFDVKNASPIMTNIKKRPLGLLDENCDEKANNDTKPAKKLRVDDSTAPRAIVSSKNAESVPETLSDEGALMETTTASTESSNNVVGTPIDSSAMMMTLLRDLVGNVNELTTEVKAISKRQDGLEELIKKTARFSNTALANHTTSLETGVVETLSIAEALSEQTSTTHSELQKLRSTIEMTTNISNKNLGDRIAQAEQNLHELIVSTIAATNDETTENASTNASVQQLTAHLQGGVTEILQGTKAEFEKHRSIVKASLKDTGSSISQSVAEQLDSIKKTKENDLIFLGEQLGGLENAISELEKTVKSQGGKAAIKNEVIW